MSEFVSDCPRCGAKSITLDCHSSIIVDKIFGWKHITELFLVCRRCHKPSIQRVSQANKNEITGRYSIKNNALSECFGSINDLAVFERFVTIRDQNDFNPPEHLPKKIFEVIEEADSCLSSQCFNAAGAMYRLALDLSTKNLIPETENPPLKSKRNLGLRIQWLIEKKILPSDLASLAQCLQQDGNDGVHDGTLSKEDAEDLHDFTYELLHRLYTEPERLRIAEKRRHDRRSRA